MTEQSPLSYHIKRVLCACLVFLSHLAMVNAQCSLQVSDHTCVDDLISLVANSTNGVSSVSWKFGDGNTSTTTSPNHRYAAAGTYTITATIQQTSGGSCTATKQITVYNAPDVDVSLDASSEYCFTQNNICVVDNSTSGNTSTTNVKRIILWGDGGKTDGNAPKKGDKICYSYQQSGPMSLTIELTNDKGCEAKQEVNIQIKHDFFGVFTTGRESKDCDKQTNWFLLDTAWYKDTVKSAASRIIMDYGDGNRDTVPMDTSVFYHDFKASGNYDVYAIIEFKNGCVTRYKRPVGISLDRVDPKPQKSDSVLCYPETFEFTHRNEFGAIFGWTALDTAGNIVDFFSGQRVGYFTPPEPGEYHIRLEIKKGDCSVEAFDTIHSVGVKAVPVLLNASQCSPKDTVIFCNQSITHGNVSLRWLWLYGDLSAPQCTTNTAKNQNVGNNCNFSNDFSGKHFYDSDMCGETWLKAYDDNYGCADSAREYVAIKIPNRDDFTVDPGSRCLNSPVLFTADDCYGSVLINFDSACDKNNFVEFEQGHAYKKTCDSTGWVTYGIIVNTGSARVYRSCDLTDFYIDSSRICNDTFWFHHAFRLNPSPKPQALLRFTGCLPSTLTGEFYVQDQPNVRSLYFDWGDGLRDTMEVPIDSSLPDFTHTYVTSGQYEGGIKMETDSGCTAEVYFDRDIGFYNNFTFSKPVCPGSTVHFVDSVVYWWDTNQYWRWYPPYKMINNPERLHWNFGDGTGWFGDTAEISHVFEKEGEYIVTMASTDKTGCSDTARHVVKVQKIKAGIKDLGKKLLCDDILQVFDSSELADSINDKITEYWWDFGDGKTPSFLKDPFHFYSSYGEFTITHVIENSVGCRDTTAITINIDGPLPHFDILSDTVACVPHTVEFKNNSTKATDYIWYLGDTSSNNNTLSTDADTNVSFTYTKPGIYYIYLYAGDSVVNPDNNNNVYYCNSTFPDTNAVSHEVRRVVILPIPEVDFDVEDIVCTNNEVVLADQSDPIYNIYRWYWDNDSVASLTENNTVVFEDTGTITIRYYPTYEPQGPYQRRCYDSIEKTIQVFDHQAEFTFTQDSICPTFNFSANIEDGNEIVWDFGHPQSGHKNTSFDANARHNFAPDIGTFEVCLQSKSKEGCTDTACVEVESNFEFDLFIPNIITPNDDGLNDYLDIEITGEKVYELSIYNRWGERVYYSNVDYGIGSELNWDGTEIKSGRPCPGGTYFYIFEFVEDCVDDAPKERYSGTVTVVRD